MQDSALEIIRKEKIAASSDMKHRPWKFLKINLHQICDTVILYEIPCGNLHSESVHLRQIPVIRLVYHFYYLTFLP